MNIPNQLTILRLVLTAAFIIFLFFGGLTAKVAAFIVFIAASVTDALDGYIAKRNNQITIFGKLMDPIADKVLILSAFLAFVELGLVPGWMVVVIIIREVAVTALRGMALARGKVISADDGGKRKTIWQILVILIILLFIIFNEGTIMVFGFWTNLLAATYQSVIFVLMSITVVLTVASGISYFMKNKEVYSDEKAH